MTVEAKNYRAAVDRKIRQNKRLRPSLLVASLTWRIISKHHCTLRYMDRKRRCSMRRKLSGHSSVYSL